MYAIQNRTSRSNGSQRHISKVNLNSSLQFTSYSFQFHGNDRQMTAFRLCTKWISMRRIPTEIFRQRINLRQKMIVFISFVEFIPWFLTPKLIPVAAAAVQLTRLTYEYRMHFIWKLLPNCKNERNKYIYFMARTPECGEFRNGARWLRFFVSPASIHQTPCVRDAREKNHPARFYSNKFSVRLSHLMYVSDGFCASSLSFHSHMVVGVVRPNIYGCLFHFRFSLIFSSIHWNLHGIVSFHFPLRSNKRYEKGKVLFSHFLFA